MNLAHVDRFWALVEKGEYCWAWAGRRSKLGYAELTLPSRSRRASRLSWQIHYGSIPNGLLVLHRCDNPGCVRPDHLFLGTHRDNTLDALRKGRLCSRTLVVKPLKTRLAKAGVTYTEVARLAGVTYRMVQWVVDGGRKSSNVMRAIERLAPKTPGNGQGGVA